MITVIRRKLKSKAAKSVFMWIIALAIALGFILSPRMFQRSEGSNKWVAYVNDKELPAVDYYLKVKMNEMILRSIQIQYREYADLFLKAFGLSSNPRVSAYNQILSQELLNQEADKLSMYLDSGFIAKRLSDANFIQREFPYIVPPEAIDPRFGLNLNILKMYLMQMGINIADFEQMAIKAIKRDALTDIIVGSAYVPEFEIKQKYSLDYLARKFDVLMLDFDLFLKKAKKEDISKAEVKKFFDEQNKIAKRYWVPEKRAGKAYLFDAASYGVSVTEDEIKNRYEDNKIRDYIEKPAEIQARRILFKLDDKDPQEVLKKAKEIQTQLLLEPSKFPEMAKKFSDDKESAQKGGLLPFFSKGARDREFEKAVFLLKDDGAVANVVKTAEGFEIAQRVARKDAVFKPFKSVEEQIKETLLDKKFRRLFSKDMNKILGKQGFDKIRLEQEIKKARKEEVIELQLKGEDSRSKALFRIRNNVPSFYFDGGKGYLVKAAEIVKRHLPSLDTIEDVVKNDIYEKKASKMLDGFMVRIKKEAASKSLDEIKNNYKSEYNLTLDQTGWIKQNDNEKVSALRTKGYPADQMLKLEKVGAVGHYRSAKEDTADGYLVKVNQLESFNNDEYTGKKDEIKKELSKQDKEMVKEEFIDFLRKKAKIKVNPAIVRLPKQS